MQLISLSFSSGKRPGCVFEQDDDTGRAQVAQGHAALVVSPAQPPKEKVEPPPEPPQILKEALELEPWPVKGARPETYLKLWPIGKKAALARKHVELRAALAEKSPEGSE